MWKNLILSGGSIYGIAHLGFIKYLEENKLIQPLNKVIGSSVGSMIASFVAFGFTTNEIWNFLMGLDVKVMAKLNLDPNFILTKLGFNDGEVVYNFLNMVFERKTGIKNITFIQMREWCVKRGMPTHLVVTGTCLNTGETIYFDYVRTPNLLVAKAVRISCSIPPLFTPVEYEDKLYIDGSIGDNFPVDEVKGEEDLTISSVIIMKYNLNVKYIEDYAYAFMMMLSRRILYYDALRCGKNTVIIDRPDVGSAYDFNINDEFKQMFFDLGYEKTRDFCLKHEARETKKDSLAESQNKSMNESKNESTNEAFNDPPADSQNKSTNESTNESKNDSTNESFNDSPTDSQNKSMNELHNDSTNESINDFPADSQNKSANESFNDSTNEKPDSHILSNTLSKILFE